MERQKRFQIPRSGCGRIRSTQVEGLIEEIRVTHSELADWLTAMAYDFEYEKIGRMVEEMEKK